ncbi:MAG: hypothetical protein P8P85_03700, partial [Acidimicrobiales bacterium]|nr:hypothetical protein [Acidimicrobiales bacterium]
MTSTSPRFEQGQSNPLLALRPRRVEAGLLVTVGVVVVVAYGLASFGTSEAIPADLGPFLLWMLG